MSSSPSKILEVFDNPNSDRDFVIRIDTSEFTCLCPLTGQPDFADIFIEYIADKHCVELKALKNYFGLIVMKVLFMKLLLIRC